MKQHTQDFKEEIKLIGKQQDVKITYGNTTLTSDEINSVTPSYEGNLLKSIMKQLDIDSNENIPVGTEIALKYGLWVNEEYEYIDFGKYIVKEVEKQEDTGSYLITCYDKLLYSMKDYEQMNISYPITVKDYLKAICNHLGLRYNETIFANEIKLINYELYLDIGYTFRDVLDEIAQVAGGVICINANDEVEIRYINDTNDTIDEEYLKDVNVNFGEKYGPINSIVLSRAGESDNVYLQNEASVAQNGLCELKIVDNQIMNFNDRSDYLPELLDRLNGIEYYLNDFTSTGIIYYDILDKYNVKIGDNTYSCLMLNDEINITQGLEELIYTDMPETSETDYTKADKTDRRINQAYIIVDKQNQTIEGVVSQTSEQNQKINRVVQAVDELNSKISDVADITTSKDSSNGILEFESINESEPIRVEIRPISENISYLYPRNNLFPSNNLYPKARTLRFTNTQTGEISNYELPSDLLYHDSENYDEFILDYDSQTCLVNKRIGLNSDGTTYVLDTPRTIHYEYPIIPLTDGDYKVELVGYNVAYLFVRLMSQNIYTTQFATKAEVQSQLSQTANSILAEVNADIETLDQNIDREITNVNGKLELKIDRDKVVSELNASADIIDLKSNRFKVESDNLSITEDGTMICNNAVIKGSAVVNDVVTIDKNGIEMADGTSIVGATGVFSIFEYDGEVTGYNPVRNGEYQALGASYVYELNVVETERMILDAYIPENFTIQKAYIHFSHYPIDAIWQGASIGSGYCRELKLYKANAESMETKYLIGGEYFHTYEDDTSEEIVNAFGEPSYTPSNYGLSDIETIDIANKLTTGKNRLIIKSTAKMPIGDDETIMKQTALMTGMVQATLVVLGFSK